MITRQDTTLGRRRGAGWNFTMWLSGIIGGIATFLGLFILFGPEDEYVGLGGDVSWRVGDISDVWMYSLLIGGIVLLGAALVMAVLGRDQVKAEATPLMALLLHAGIFTAVNAFIWIQDFAIGGGLDYAHFTTIPWAIGLAFHIGSYFYETGSRARVPEDVESKELQLH